MTIKLIKRGIVIIAVTLSSFVYAGSNGEMFSGVSDSTVFSGKTSHGRYDPGFWAIRQFAREYFTLYDNNEGNVDEVMQEFDPIADYETYIPYENRLAISDFESRLLIRYLENPGDVRAAKIMAAYHLLHMPAGHGTRNKISRIQHAILAQYFLNRAKQLSAHNACDAWIDFAIRITERKLAVLLPVNRPLDLTEGNPAHKAFLEAFVFTESHRFSAEEKLFTDVLSNPTNLLTNLYIAAVNLWNAGEAPYDDPTALYAYIKASYFGKRITGLSQRAEQEWEADPQNHKLFRLAPTVAGFSFPSRRWLAKFHGDAEAVELLDEEIGDWLAKYPSFYSFPASVYAFTEPENVVDGLMAQLAGTEACTANFNVFCDNQPRVSYNIISFFLYSFDYFMKVGDKSSALGMLGTKVVPYFAYDTWTLGHAAWEHRENNADAIAALYQNDDPADDPVHAFLKRRKWGPESSTCQLCHQAQGASLTEEDLENVRSLDEASLYVKDWPEVKVSWFGSVID